MAAVKVDHFLVGQPPAQHSNAQGGSLAADRLASVRENHTLTVKNDPCIAASVTVLDLRRRPSAIAGFVVSVVVDPVKRHPRRTFAHVFKEWFERLPTVAKRDASATVVFPLRPAGVGASAFHGFPSAPRFGCVLSVRHSSVGVQADSITAARGCSEPLDGSLYVAGSGVGFVSAIALETPPVDDLLPIRAYDGIAVTDHNKHVVASPDRDRFSMCHKHLYHIAQHTSNVPNAGGRYHS